jgi:hypothetical protein
LVGKPKQEAGKVSGWVNPQKIVVAAIFIACGNLINPLTDHLDQCMFHMSR